MRHCSLHSPSSTKASFDRRHSSSAFRVRSHVQIDADLDALGGRAFRRALDRGRSRRCRRRILRESRRRAGERRGLQEETNNCQPEAVMSKALLQTFHQCISTPARPTLAAPSGSGNEYQAWAQVWRGDSWRFGTRCAPSTKALPPHPSIAPSPRRWPVIRAV